MLDSYAQTPYCISRPAVIRVPYVFNSPHSGNFYAPEFIATTRLDHTSIRKSEDFMVDTLYENVVPLGAPMLKANFPRAWLDVNREPYELDPTMFDGPLPNYANTHSTRVNGGLGTIAKIVAEGEFIYRNKLAPKEGLNRIETLYKPYHAALRGLLAKSVNRFGHAVLIDCHSMPSCNGRAIRSNKQRADFVIGDRYGTACAPELTHSAAEFLRDLGYQVSINKPYAGGFITEHYGRPENQLHAIQIEINRALYMDEARFKPSANFANLQNDLTTFTSRLVSIPEYVFKRNSSLAAE